MIDCWEGVDEFGEIGADAIAPIPALHITILPPTPIRLPLGYGPSTALLGSW